MKLPPAWFLFLFAPLPVECVSGSSPYLNPFVWLANFLLYGAGTLLIREWRVRRGRGWLAVFLLAAAYMVAEEGLMLNTLFDPDKNTVGRALGVNWVWTAGMLVVHSLASIFAPIMLAESLYPERAAKPWLTPWVAFGLAAAFLANVFGLGRLMAPSHRPPIAYWVIEIAFIAVCIGLSAGIPPPRPAENAPQPSSAGRLFALSLGGMALTMIVNFAAPALKIPSPLQIILMLGACFFFLTILRRRRAFAPDLPPLSRFAVASGIIAFWIVTSPFGSLARHSPGPLLFGIFVGVFLWRARRRLSPI